MVKINLTTYLIRYNWLSCFLCITGWVIPFFISSIFWEAYSFIALYALTVYFLKKLNNNSKTLYELPRLEDTSRLLSDVSALYRWEREQHPFLDNLAGIRFAKKENPQKLEDFEAIYINSRDNVIYLFNLDNQKPKAQLRGFMIEDLLSFYMVIKLPAQQKSNNYMPHFVKTNIEKLRHTLLYIKQMQRAMVHSFQLVFEIRGIAEKRLEATLYPPHPDNMPYLVTADDPWYHALVRKGTNIISFLEVLQGGFFWETEPVVSIDGVLRVEFIHKNN